MAGPSRLAIEVVDAQAQHQAIVKLDLAAGATVADAVAASGLVGQSGLGELAGRLGIFGRLCPPTQPLCDGDRVEIYRELLQDPKQARRARARQRRRG